MPNSPPKCVVVEVHVYPVPVNTPPEEIAELVQRCLEGRSVFPYKLKVVDSQDCDLKRE